MADNPVAVLPDLWIDATGLVKKMTFFHGIVFLLSFHKKKIIFDGIFQLHFPVTYLSPALPYTYW
jgi:hypothetical protein